MPDLQNLDTISPSVPTVEPTRSRQQRLLGCACSTGVVLLFYVLAAGPMAWLHKAIPFKPFRTAIEVVFAPIVWLAKHHVEPLSSIIKAYVELFR